MRLFTKLVHALAICSGAAAAASGCAGSDPSHVQQDQFQAQIIHALCDSVLACCTAAHRGFDPVHCRQTVVQEFVVPLSDTTLLYDSAQAGRCVQAVTAAAQACQSVDITTCYDAFIGNIPPGSPCKSSFECEPGPDAFAVCGPDNLCAQPRRGALGDPCAFSCIEDGVMAHCHSIFYGPQSGSSAACHSANGLVCVETAMGSANCEPLSADCRQNPTQACPPTAPACNLMTGQCFVPVPLGGACTATAPCSSDGYCAAGICYPVKANAIPCAQDVECASGKCDHGFCVVYSQAAATWCGESTLQQ